MNTKARKGGSMQSTKEAAIRRLARRNGYVLRKSRTRNPDAPEFGSYWLVNADSNALVRGGQFGTDLNDIAQFLQD